MDLSPSEMRKNALNAAQARRKGSVPPKVTAIELMQDRKPFLELVNKIKGAKPASEALELLKLLRDISTRARDHHTTMQSECKVRAQASKFQVLLRCKPAMDLFNLIGFRRRVDEMEEVYTIPILAARPILALTLLETGIIVLREEIEYLEAEEYARRERAEREKLASKGAREVALDKFQNDRRRVAQRKVVPTSPRFTSQSTVLGSE